MLRLDCGEMESHLEQQEEYFVALDGESLSLWNDFKTAEGVSTDSEAAKLLLKQFEQPQDSKPFETANCAQCNSPLPLLCGNCRTQDKSPDPPPHDDALEQDQDPMIYRVLRISADGEADTESGTRTKRQKHHPGLENPHLLLATAKELAGSGKSVIIVDYFSRSQHDIHEMCSENDVFAAVQQSDEFVDEDGVRVSLSMDRQQQNPNYHNAVPNTTYYVQEHPGHQIDQVANVVTMVPTADGDHWMEQLIYGDTATQSVRRPGDPEAATAAAALEALSSDVPLSVPNIAYQTLKGKPRKTRNGKPIPSNRIRTCRACGRHCFSPSDLKRHMLLHTGEKPFSCDECGASFRQRGNWKKHKIEVHGSKNHLCPECGVRFALVEDLHRHMRFHSSDRRHTCQLCRSSFKTARNLRLHMRTHTEARPYQCNECGIHFATRRKLITHSQTHIGGKLFKCLECEATFSDHKSLTKHKDSHQSAPAKRKRHPSVQMRYIITSQPNAVLQAQAQSQSHSQAQSHLQSHSQIESHSQVESHAQTQSHLHAQSLPQAHTQAHSQTVDPHSQSQLHSQTHSQVLSQPQYTVPPLTQSQQQYVVPSHQQYNVPQQPQYSIPSHPQPQYILPSKPQ